MIDNFNDWSANLAETGPMEQLKGAVVGIEASEFLNRLSKFEIPEVDRKVEEALLPALGGLPFGLRAVIRKILEIWKDHGITPVFVFSGLDVGKRDPTFIFEEEGARINAQAWAYYDAAQGDRSVLTFGESGSVTAEHLYRYLQVILNDADVQYQVAPYGAWAQLAYLQAVGTIDTIYSSSEVLLFNVPDLITGWDFIGGNFVWVRKQACLLDLKNISEDAFIDACLLAGSALLPAIPQLDSRQYYKQPKIRGAVDMVMRIGRGNGHNVCLNYKDDPIFQSMDYLNRYRRARMAVKHHVVLLDSGKVEPFAFKDVPSNIHECIGQQLPEELYFYLSKGIIGPRVLNWRTSNDIVEPPPLDGGDSVDYRKLVGEQLTPIRTTTIRLLSQSLHRFNLHHDINLRCWFDKDNVTVVKMTNVEDGKAVTDNWNVHEETFAPYLDSQNESGILGTCIKLVQTPGFAAKSRAKRDSKNPLQTKDEILYNSIWRLLHLRGYIDEKHELTPWGQVLYEMVANTPSSDDEESALITVELARFALPNADDMFPSYSGGPRTGSEKDKRNTRLLSRILCVGKFHHKEIGYTGPLSRDLLGFHSMISAVRGSLRDLAEVCLTTLLLNGEAERTRKDWIRLGLDLPFLLHNDCILGLAASAYFADIVGKSSNPTSAQKEASMTAAEAQFRWAVDYKADVKDGFKLWDAVYKGIQAAPATFRQKAIFDEANSWLSALR